jgi:hypothetical protein
MLLPSNPIDFALECESTKLLVIYTTGIHFKIWNYSNVFFSVFLLWDWLQLRIHQQPKHGSKFRYPLVFENIVYKNCSEFETIVDINKSCFQDVPMRMKHLWRNKMLGFVETILFWMPFQNDIPEYWMGYSKFVRLEQLLQRIYSVRMDGQSEKYKSRDIVTMWLPFSPHGKEWQKRDAENFLPKLKTCFRWGVRWNRDDRLRVRRQHDAMDERRPG